MAKTIRQALRGRSDFISDIYVKDMLYAATVRCPYPHARILRIVTDSLDGKVVLVTAEDIPGPNSLDIGSESMPILARRECNYSGEPVALLAGESQRAVVEAMRQLIVEYEELPALVDTGDSRDAAVVARRKGSRGDAKMHLGECHQIVQGTYRTGIQEHLYNEPQGAVVEPQGEGVIVRTATQWPFHVRDTVASNLRIAGSECAVRASDPGISLDGKLWYPSLVATHAALLAVRSGRAVKLVYSNIEDYQYTPKRSPFTISYLTGLDRDGNLVAATVSLRYNAGAYPLFTDEMTSRVLAAALGSYKCDHLEVDIAVTQTNLPPLNVLSGFGMAAPFFGLETHASRIAELTGRDGGEWRIANLSHGGRNGGTRVSESARIRTVIETALEHSDYERKSASYELQRKRRAEFADLRRPTMGVGMSYAFQGADFIGGHSREYGSTVVVRLESDGVAVVRTSAIPGSDALRGSWARLVSSILGLDSSDVRIEAADTALVPDSGPSTLSRNITVVTHLIEQACNAIQRKRFRNPLPIEVRRSSRSSRARTWDPRTLSGVAFGSVSHAAAVVETRVDPVTYESSVQGVWLAVDAGQIVNEGDARRSLEMSVHQALEWATHEVVVYRDGEVDPRSYLSYRNNGSPVLPTIKVILVESPVRSPNGIGELPQSCIPAALAAAVTQATGRYMDQIPTNPALIHGYVEQAGVEEADDNTVPTSNPRGATKPATEEARR